MGRAATKIWTRVNESRARLEHMKKLRKEGLGHNRDEFYVRKTQAGRKSGTSQGRKYQKAINLAMETKISDEQKHQRDLKEEMAVVRKDLTRIYGKNSMGFKKAVRKGSEGWIQQ